MARRRSEAAEGQAIDLTPMLDVTFILLIFFIVTAQFIKTPGVDINRVDVENDKAMNPLGILIAIDSNSDVWIDKTKIDIRELEYYIREMRESNPKGKLVLQVDNDSDAETLDEAMQAVVAADPLGSVEISTELD